MSRDQHTRRVVHDFMLPNATGEAKATRAAIAQVPGRSV
jgi:hypothetical protein